MTSSLERTENLVLVQRDRQLNSVLKGALTTSSMFELQKKRNLPLTMKGINLDIGYYLYLEPFMNSQMLFVFPISRF